MSAETLEILEPGILTTVQDGGRYGYQRFGVPVSGAMDAFAMRAANILVGNDEGYFALVGQTAEPEWCVLDEIAPPDFDEDTEGDDDLDFEML